MSKTKKTKADPRWRQFEKTIQAIFEKNPRAKVTRDAVVKGRSGRKRKLELLVDYPFSLSFGEGFKATFPIRIAVDCKQYRGTVGIKRIEEFHGQMEDIAAQVGIMVAATGFDAGAKARAPQLNVFLVNATWDLLALARGVSDAFDFYECRECRAARDSLNGHVHFAMGESPHEVVWGECDWCNAHHAVCPDCGEVTGFCESDLQEWIECSGACERLYRVGTSDMDGYREQETISGIQRTILIKLHKAKRLDKKQLDAILSATKWQYGARAGFDPVCDLDGQGRATLKGNRLISNSETRIFVEKELPAAKDSYYGW